MNRLIAVLAVGSLVSVGSASLAGSAPASSTRAASGGVVHVFGAGNGNAGEVVLTGAIGDSGTHTMVDADGKADPNGNYVKLALKLGSLELNLTTLGKLLATASPNMSTATCSAFISETAPAALLDGTGSYTGISGSVKLTITFAFLLPRYTNGAHKGMCNESNSATPTAQQTLVTGSGSVSFS